MESRKRERGSGSGSPMGDKRSRPAKKRVFELRSLQADAFKHLFEIFGSFLEDMNVILTEEGLEIRTMDRAHIALAHLKVNPESLELFACSRPMVLGINLRQINTLFKAATPKDHLHMYIEEGKEERLVIGFESESKVLYFEYVLLDLEETPVSLPDVPYDIDICISSKDLHRYLRDMAPVGDELSITVGQGENPQITLSIKGDYAEGRLDLKQLLNREEDAGPEQILDTDPKSISDCGLKIVYPLSYLHTFSRASVLGPSVSVYLKREFPIVLCYAFSNMGLLTFMVAPKDMGSD